MIPIKGVILLAFVLGSLPLCLVRPFYGILLWTVLGILNPQSGLFYWSTALAFPWAEGVAVPTIVGSVVFSGVLKKIFCREGVLLMILWGWFTLTTLNSVQTPLFASNAQSTWLQWETFSKIALMTLITLGLTDTWQRLRYMLWAIAGSFGYLVLKAIPFIIMTGGASRIYGPANSMVADNNDMGLALNMTLPIFFFLAKTETDKRLKRLMYFLFLAAIPAICLTYSRGAFVGLLAVSVCMLMQARQKAVLIPVSVMVLLCAAFFAPQDWRDRMSTTNPQALDTSALSRLNAWTYSWRLAGDFPLMGGGFDSFTPELFQRYAPNSIDVHGPHSIYFGVLAEHGFTGLFLYLCLVVSCFASTRKTIKLARSMGHEQAVMYANMFRFALVGFLVSGTFLGRAYFDFYFTIVACIAVLNRLVALEWKQQTPCTPEEELEDDAMSEAFGATEARA